MDFSKHKPSKTQESSFSREDKHKLSLSALLGGVGDPLGLSWGASPHGLGISPMHRFSASVIPSPPPSRMAGPAALELLGRVTSDASHRSSNSSDGEENDNGLPSISPTMLKGHHNKASSLLSQTTKLQEENVGKKTDLTEGGAPGAESSNLGRKRKRNSALYFDMEEQEKKVKRWLRTQPSMTLRFDKETLGFRYFPKLEALRSLKDYTEAHGEFCISVANAIMRQLEKFHSKPFSEVVLELEGWGEIPKNLKFIGKGKRSGEKASYYFRPSTLNWKFGEFATPLGAALACDIFHRLFHFRGDILLRRTSAYIPPSAPQISFETE